MLVKIPAGKGVAEHIYPNQDDILYPLDAAPVQKKGPFSHALRLWRLPPLLQLLLQPVIAELVSNGYR